MFSQILRQDVETFADALLAQSPLLGRARTGSLPVQAVGNYLEGLRYLTRETMNLLSAAAACADRISAPELARHYRDKMSEEIGHHRWAEQDIDTLERAFEIRVSRRDSASLLSLMKFLHAEIQAHPVRLLAYELLTEHLTVLVGPEWLAALEQGCGIPRVHLSVVSNHVELDKDHVDEGLLTIDRFVSESDLDDLRHTIRVASAYLGAFFDECAETALAA